MRIKLNNPARFSQRKLTRFAYLPKKVEDCYIWLEKYLVVQYYDEGWKNQNYYLIPKEKN